MANNISAIKKNSKKTKPTKYYSNNIENLPIDLGSNVFQATKRLVKPRMHSTLPRMLIKNPNSFNFEAPKRFPYTIDRKLQLVEEYHKLKDENKQYSFNI